MQHKVRLTKSGMVRGTMSEAACTALGSIDGVEQVRVLESGEDWAIAEYDWTKESQIFDKTDEWLAKYGLRRDWKWGKDPLRRLKVLKSNVSTVPGLNIFEFCEPDSTENIEYILYFPGSDRVLDVQSSLAHATSSAMNYVQNAEEFEKNQNVKSVSELDGKEGWLKDSAGEKSFVRFSNVPKRGMVHQKIQPPMPPAAPVPDPGTPKRSRGGPRV